MCAKTAYEEYIYHVLLFRLHLTQKCLLRIHISSCLGPEYYFVRAHEQQAENRQGYTDCYVQPPTMADRKDCLTVGPLGSAEEAHTKDTADE